MSLADEARLLQRVMILLDVSYIPTGSMYGISMYIFMHIHLLDVYGVLEHLKAELPEMFGGSIQYRSSPKTLDV